MIGRQRQILLMSSDMGRYQNAHPKEWNNCYNWRIKVGILWLHDICSYGRPASLEGLLSFALALLSHVERLRLKSSCIGNSATNEKEARLIQTKQLWLSLAWIDLLKALQKKHMCWNGDYINRWQLRREYMAWLI